MNRLFGALQALLCLLPCVASADDALWAQLREGGHVILIRHAATEPGVGDPPGFRIGDCRTQRNLSEAGRAAARRLGEAFRARGVPIGEVRSSQWCRCLDTARIAFGKAEPWPALNSLFNDATREPAATAAVLDAGEALRPPRNLVLVTHNFNIRALTGISPGTSEVIVTRPAGPALQLVGRIPAP